MLAEIIGALPAEADGAAPRASGTLEAHYAPATPVRLVDARALTDAGDDVVAWVRSIPIPPDRRGWSRAPADATRYAHDLYAALRTMDARGARAIWIERPPDAPEWAGVNDRLRRAAGGIGRFVKPIRERVAASDVDLIEA